MTKQTTKNVEKGVKVMTGRRCLADSSPSTPPLVLESVDYKSVVKPKVPKRLGTVNLNEVEDAVQTAFHSLISVSPSTS